MSVGVVTGKPENDSLRCDESWRRFHTESVGEAQTTRGDWGLPRTLMPPPLMPASAVSTNTDEADGIGVQTPSEMAGGVEQ